MNDRYRLVRETLRGDERYVNVSGTILAPDEIWETLEWEAELHSLTGWEVSRDGGGKIVWPGGLVRAEKPGCVRWLYVRTCNPMEDTL